MLARFPDWKLWRQVKSSKTFESTARKRLLESVSKSGTNWTFILRLLAGVVNDNWPLKKLILHFIQDKNRSQESKPRGINSYDELYGEVPLEKSIKFFEGHGTIWIPWVEVYERVGKFVISLFKKAFNHQNKHIWWLWKWQGKFLSSWFIHVKNTHHIQRLHAEFF